MRTAKLLLVIVCFAALAQGQSYDQCQQQCTDMYNLCTSNADQEWNQCLAAVQDGGTRCHSCFARYPGQSCPFDCSADNGCPIGQVTCRLEDCCDASASSATTTCNSEHDMAYSSCATDYQSCSSTCYGIIPPAAVRRKFPDQRKALNDASWALLMRKLSRPEKLKLVL